jgi:hypothetical protein
VIEGLIAGSARRVHTRDLALVGGQHDRRLPPPARPQRVGQPGLNVINLFASAIYQCY